MKKITPVRRPHFRNNKSHQKNLAWEYVDREVVVDWAKRRGLTTTALGLLVGVAPVTVRTWLNGNRLPGEKSQKRLLALLPAKLRKRKTRVKVARIPQMPVRVEAEVLLPPPSTPARRPRVRNETRGEPSPSSARAEASCPQPSTPAHTSEADKIQAISNITVAYLGTGAGSFSPTPPVKEVLDLVRGLKEALS